MPSIEFKGKQFVYSHHLSVPFRELTVDAKKSLPKKGKKPSLDDNLIIHGDNLEALKALLPTHAGKVDCIFIDPPYNTGNEGWCYNDNVRSPLMKEWLKKSANPVDKEDLERHDKWLCMMWPRLNLLRELLADHGVIFISIDDNEQHRLRCLMDEVFGEMNFMANMIWQKRYAVSSDAKGIPEMHDHILCYQKTSEFSPNMLARTEKQDGAYSNPDNDPRGPWRSDNLLRSEYRERDVYPVVNPNTGEKFIPPPGSSWRHPENTIKKMIEDGRIYFGKDGKGRPVPKRYLQEVKQGIVASGWMTFDEVGHTDEAKRQLKQMFAENKDIFATPKPVRLLQRILKIATDENSLVLDSFAGSGTTAHAVLAANKKDGGNRRFILVECEEYADGLTAERVRRVINGYTFQGNQREQLYSEKITWSNFSKKAQAILEKVESIEQLEGADYDKVSKQIKDGMLTVTGERKITEKVPGLGGSFTFCELGTPIQVESLLTGEDMPDFEALARYVFYTATGQSLEGVPKPSASGFIGENGLFRVHLIYQPDKTWLRSNEAALNAERVEAITKENKSGKRAIVFAVAKFMSQKELTKQRIEFCQLPYAIHRILGD